jgi:F0F1-type ATP synthase assembly protein I
VCADKRLPGWVRHSGVGLELAAAVGGFTLAGYWIDRYYGSQPWGTVIGVILGMIGGLYNLVRQSLQAAREAQIDDQEEARRHEDGGGA